MKLIAHVIDGHHVDIRPAPVERDWMEATSQRFAYRCLPLNIANAYGWEVLCNAGFLAMWWGGEGLDSIVIEPDPGTIAPAISHFGHGILTFHLPCLFSTEPGAELMVQGPINRPKDGIAALSGVIERSPYSFTGCSPGRARRSASRRASLIVTFFQCGAARSKTSSRSLRCSLPTLTSSASTIRGRQAASASMST